MFIETNVYEWDSTLAGVVHSFCHALFYKHLIPPGIKIKYSPLTGKNPPFTDFLFLPDTFPSTFAS